MSTDTANNSDTPEQTDPEQPDQTVVEPKKRYEVIEEDDTKVCVSKTPVTGGKRKSKKGSKKSAKKTRKNSTRKSSTRKNKKGSKKGKKSQKGGSSLAHSDFNASQSIATSVDKTTSLAGSIDSGLFPSVQKIQGGSKKRGGGCGNSVKISGGKKSAKK